jgi:hypothetical protein
MSFRSKNEKNIQFEIIKCFPEEFSENEQIMMELHREIKEKEKNSIHEITYSKKNTPLISIKRKDIIIHLAVGFHKVVYNMPRNTRVYFFGSDVIKIFEDKNIIKKVHHSSRGEDYDLFIISNFDYTKIKLEEDNKYLKYQLDLIKKDNDKLKDYVTLINTDIDEKISQIKVKENELNYLREYLFQKDKYLNEISAKLAENQYNFDCLTTSYVQENKNNNDLKLCISEKDKVINSLNLHITILEKEINKISTSSKRRQESMNTLFTQNNNLSNENALMKEKIKKLSIQLHAKEEELQENKKRKL